MSVDHLYDIWFRRIRELLSAERITRVRNMVWLMVGLSLSRSVHLSQIAAKLPLPATLLSTVRRLTRFLQNGDFKVRPWYRSLVQPLLAEAARHGPLRLIADASKVSAQHRLLMVALAYRKRALPLAWTWVNSVQGHSSAFKQIALLDYVRRLLPEQAQVIVVGDCEFGAVAVLQQLQRWHWQYALRQKENAVVCVSLQRRWEHFADLVSAKDEPCWYPHALLTLELLPTSLLAFWQSRQAQPWLLATNLPDAQATLRAYRRRMWIEEMFGDWKGHGLNIEKTRLSHVYRLARLVFAVSLWYLWLITQGSRTIKAAQRHLVDRKGRRDLSIFRIGLYMIDRRFARGQPCPIHLVPYF
jgi:hypothetical protein